MKTWLSRIAPLCVYAMVIGHGLLLAGQTPAAQIRLAITTDTYIDSRTTNTGKNYGAANTVRTVVNSSDASVTRGLFRLPTELDWYSTDQILQAVVSFYVWQDNTGTRNVTLYPLSHEFVEGTGNGTIPADGATWYTYDGTNAWTQPGGDFDTNFAVVGVKGPILDTNMNDRFFYWDVTSLLTNETSRSNLLTYGAMLHIDELPIPTSGTPRAPFTSSDDMAYTAVYRPHVTLQIAPRTAEVFLVSVDTNGLMLALTNCTPLVTNRVEYTFDLADSTGWLTLTDLVATSQSTNWVLPMQPDWTQVFYRVVVAP